MNRTIKRTPSVTAKTIKKIVRLNLPVIELEMTEINPASKTAIITASLIIWSSLLFERLLLIFKPINNYIIYI